MENIPTFNPFRNFCSLKPHVGGRSCREKTKDVLTAKRNSSNALDVPEIPLLGLPAMPKPIPEIRTVCTGNFRFKQILGSPGEKLVRNTVYIYFDQVFSGLPLHLCLFSLPLFLNIHVHRYSLFSQQHVCSEPCPLSSVTEPAAQLLSQAQHHSEGASGHKLILAPSSASPSPLLCFHCVALGGDLFPDLLALHPMFIKFPVPLNLCAVFNLPFPNRFFRKCFS